MSTISINNNNNHNQIHQEFAILSSSHNELNQLEGSISNTNHATTVDQLTTVSLDNLSIFGSKPNAIVRPLQRDTPPASDGALTNGIAKRIKRLEDDKNFLDKLTQKRNFNKPTIARDDLHHNKPLFITTVPRGIFLPPAQPLPPIPNKKVSQTRTLLTSS